MAKGNSGFANIPNIKNPAGIPRNAITEDEFLALRGVRDTMSGYTIDKTRSNRTIRTQRGKERFEKETADYMWIRESLPDVPAADSRISVMRQIF